MSSETARVDFDGSESLGRLSTFAFVAHSTAYFRIKVARNLSIRPAFEFDSMPRVINGNGTI